MTQEEWRAFVSHSTRTGKLSTVREDGSPHIAPVWFVIDGDTFGRRNAVPRELSSGSRSTG